MLLLDCRCFPQQVLSDSAAALEKEKCQNTGTMLGWHIFWMPAADSPAYCTVEQDVL